MNNRQYHIDSVSVQTGQKTRMTSYATSHDECMVMISKMTDHAFRRLELCEESPAQKNAQISESMALFQCEKFSDDSEKQDVTRIGKSYFRVTRKNAAAIAARIKTAHRTYPAGAYKRSGSGREYPALYLGMTTTEYVVKFQAMNNFGGAHVLPIDFAALGNRPAATYENGALDFDVIEEANEDYFAESAAQDVAQVVAQAVAAVAIAEAMQPSEATESRELVTCEAGENEAQAPSMGSAATVPAWIRSMESTDSRPFVSPFTPAPEFVPDTPAMEFLGDATPGVAEFLDALAAADDAWEKGKESAQAMEKFPRGAMGLILDSAKSTPEYQAAKTREFDSIARIKTANTYLLKNFKAEYLKHRALQRAAKLAPTPTVAPEVTVTEYVTRTGKDALITKTWINDTGTLCFSYIGKYGAGSGQGGSNFDCVMNTMRADHPGMRLDTPPVVESTEAQAPTVAEFLPEAPVFDSYLATLYENRLPTTYARIKRGECFQFSKDGPAFIKCARGYRPGCGGELLTGNPKWLVFFHDSASGLTDKEHQDAGLRTHSDIKPAKPQDAPAATQASEPTRPMQTVKSKSGKWSARLFVRDDGMHCMTFHGGNWDDMERAYPTTKNRMEAMQAMAMAADAPTDTPPASPAPEQTGAVLKSETPQDQAVQIGHRIIKGHNVSWLNDGRVHMGRELFDLLAVDPESIDWTAKTPGEFDQICKLIAQEKEPPSPVAVSSVRRSFVPAGGAHIVEDAFEAWTYHHDKSGKFGFVMYLGKSAKPWKYYSYPTEAKRDDGFERHAVEARDILAHKATRKAASKVQADKPHGLQVGDVVRSSWGYDQTNIDHYQIVKVIGKRTVEVRKLAEHHESTGDMTGRASPIHGEFVGDVLRRSVDSYGEVNMLSASYGRASKIEPLAVVHGVRCYAASSYSSYA